jgi:hypothetical protein
VPEMWFVRGVPEDLTKAIATAARAHGLTVGRLVVDALQAHLRRLEQPEPMQPSHTEAHPISDVLERLEVLETWMWPRSRRAAPRLTSSAERSSPRATLVDRVAALALAGMRPEAIAAATGVSRASVYRYIAERTAQPTPDGLRPASASSSTSEHRAPRARTDRSGASQANPEGRATRGHPSRSPAAPPGLARTGRRSQPADLFDATPLGAARR